MQGLCGVLNEYCRDGGIHPLTLICIRLINECALECLVFKCNLLVHSNAMCKHSHLYHEHSHSNAKFSSNAYHNAPIIFTLPATVWPKSINGSLNQSPANPPASIPFYPRQQASLSSLASHSSTDELLGNIYPAALM